MTLTNSLRAEINQQKQFATQLGGLGLCKNHAQARFGKKPKTKINFKPLGPVKHTFWENYIWIIITRSFCDLLEWMIKENKCSSKHFELELLSSDWNSTTHTKKVSKCISYLFILSYGKLRYSIKYNQEMWLLLKWSKYLLLLITNKITESRFDISMT